MFAYDYLFEQQRNSHDEYLVNKDLLKDHLKWKNTSNQWADMIIVRHLGQSSQDSRNLSKYQIARGRSPSESTGALDMNSSDKSCTIKHLLIVWQHNITDSDNSLRPENMDIVEKILRIIKDPLGRLA